MKIVENRIVRHAAHYMYDHPGRGHDLEQWLIAMQPEDGTQLPAGSHVIVLGLPEDARMSYGFCVEGVQHWLFEARRPMSPGTCERCQ